jgi:formamidopyrimidine-DNA glycosylase
VPEGLEVELYRQLAERFALDRVIATVAAPDSWYLKNGLTASELGSALEGASLSVARRIGKLLLLDTSGGDTVGVRFGMTGRLIVDDRAGIDQLEYSTHRDHPSWNRIALHFADGGELRVSDPRRLGAVLLNPPIDLGPDALAITPSELRVALDGSRAPIKARLLDQQRIAGLGNLLVDEVLWRAGIDPTRPARSLEPAEVKRLHVVIRRTLPRLLAKGGSHRGDLMDARVPGGLCPRDGSPLRRQTVGGRTTYWCPAHQA